MKKIFGLLLALLALSLVVALLLTGCDKIFSNNGDEYSTEELTAPDYSELELSQYVKLGDYKGIRIAIGHVDESMTADIVLWNSIVDNAQIIEYPPEALSYYEEQTTRLYMSYADKGDMSYDELMSSLGKTSEDIENEAKEYVKSDLVRLAIIEVEGLELTESEKTRLFDKYVQKFVSIYGYSEEYVKDQLDDEIYDSMQYDKMMEFLLLNNEVIENFTEEEQ